MELTKEIEGLVKQVKMNGLLLDHENILPTVSTSRLTDIRGISLEDADENAIEVVINCVPDVQVMLGGEEILLNNDQVIKLIDALIKCVALNGDNFRGK